MTFPFGHLFSFQGYRSKRKGKVHNHFYFFFFFEHWNNLWHYFSLSCVGFGGLLHQPSIRFRCISGRRQGSSAERGRATGPGTAGKSKGKVVFHVTDSWNVCLWRTVISSITDTNVFNVLTYSIRSLIKIFQTAVENIFSRKNQLESVFHKGHLTGFCISEQSYLNVCISSFIEYTHLLQCIASKLWVLMGYVCESLSMNWCGTQNLHL